MLDCGSTDRTVEICRSFTDRVFETDWPGFGIQKNRALSHAGCEWVLSLDADERVTPALAAEIQSRLPDTEGERSGHSLPVQLPGSIHASRRLA